MVLLKISYFRYFFVKITGEEKEKTQKDFITCEIFGKIVAIIINNESWNELKLEKKLKIIAPKQKPGKFQASGC